MTLPSPLFCLSGFSVPAAQTITARIDFSDPGAGSGSGNGNSSSARSEVAAKPRLRHAFGIPVQVLRADLLGDVRSVIRQADALARQGLWCVGYLRYEAAAAFDSALQTHAAADAGTGADSGGPLAWFGVYDQALPWDAPDAQCDGNFAVHNSIKSHNKAGNENGSDSGNESGNDNPMRDSAAPEPTVAWQPTLARAQFDQDFAAIQAAIAQGVYYQVNYTAQWHGRFVATQAADATNVVPASAHASDPPVSANADIPAIASGTGTGTDTDIGTASPSHAPAEALFSALRRAQPQGYVAFIDSGEEQVLSVSPELFFHWQDGRILARPVKGTAARGSTAEADAAQARHLRESPKERAENVMIVDLLRNDISRIAEPHTVRVPRLFGIEALPSVWQMASDVEARTRAGIGLEDVFAALFPCGSVTGAPKVQAMRAIHALEPGPRGVYCGAVGVLQPGGAATFNVPIRTVTVRGAQLRCGIGSGVTSGARAEEEWQEWRHKRAFLDRASAPFDLLETLALRNGIFGHADAHLARMQGAARHFGYPWHAGLVTAALAHLTAAHPHGNWRVRLVLNASGTPQAQAFALEPDPPQVRLALASRAFEEAGSEFVRFKTTRRAHYDAFAPTQAGVFDTVLWNTCGQLTETTRGNIAVLLQGQWVTPPLDCGLLPGIGRAHWLHKGRMAERVVMANDLVQAEAVAFVNSLRGWIPAVLQAASGGGSRSGQNEFVNGPALGDRR